MGRIARWGWTASSAVLLLLCFPNGAWMPHGFGMLAWVALVPLLIACLGRRDSDAPLGPRNCATHFYVFAFLFQAGNCYWILPCMRNFGDLPWAVAGLALAVYAAILSCWYGLAGFCFGLIARRSRNMALIAFPFLWVGAEMGRSRVNGIAWCFLGQSQVDARIAQWVAPWLGVVGLSFVVAAAGAAFFAGARALGRRTDSGSSPWRVGWLVVPMLVLGTPFPRWAQQGSQQALLLQPNEPLTDQNWLGPKFEEQMTAYGTLMANAKNPAQLSTAPDIIVWPESPAPLSENDPRFRQAAANFARQYGAPMILGNTAAESISPAPGLPRVRAYFNAATFVSPDGQLAGRYDKMHLVPFGEYVPYKNMLAFLHNLTQGAGDLTPGRERKLFRVNGHAYGVFICYESVFGNEVRQFAANGADVLVNISDDAWYGDTSAPFQHVDQTRMRAIENRKWILLDTNNGVTASIAPAGRMEDAVPRNIATAVRVPFSFVQETTFYSRHGDWFAWLCVIVAAALTGWSVLARSSHPQEQKIKSS